MSASASTSTSGLPSLKNCINKKDDNGDFIDPITFNAIEPARAFIIKQSEKVHHCYDIDSIYEWVVVRKNPDVMTRKPISPEIRNAIMNHYYKVHNIIPTKLYIYNAEVPILNRNNTRTKNKTTIIVVHNREFENVFILMDKSIETYENNHKIYENEPEFFDFKTDATRKTYYKEPVQNGWNKAEQQLNEGDRERVLEILRKRFLAFKELNRRFNTEIYEKILKEYKTILNWDDDGNPILKTVGGGHLNKYKYKNRFYKLHKGPRGGQYIIVEGIKKYI
jgi:hypothetical protein